MNNQINNKSNTTVQALQSIDRGQDSPNSMVRTVVELADDPLLEGLQKLAVRRRKLVSELLAYLGEVDERRLYRRFATSSMFAFCVERLRLSEPSAYRYLAAARLAKRYPLALERLEQGRVHLAALALLSKHVNDENACELLELADGQSKRQLERALAARFPRADVPSGIRKLRQLHSDNSPRAPGRPPALANPVTPAVSVSTADSEVNGPNVSNKAAPPAPSAASRPRVEPLRARRYRIQFSASQSFVDKLEKAQALLGHQVPSGDLETVLEMALETLVATKMKQKFALTDRSRKTRPPSATPKPASGEPVANKPAKPVNSRHIPAAVKRAVLERDGMRCSYVDESGHQCEQISSLEFHHKKPFARGGLPTADNLTLRCRSHNFYQAELDFGLPLLRRRVLRRRARADTGRRAHAPNRIALPGESTAEP